MSKNNVDCEYTENAWDREVRTPTNHKKEAFYTSCLKFTSRPLGIFVSKERGQQNGTVNQNTYRMSKAETKIGETLKKIKLGLKVTDVNSYHCHRDKPFLTP